MKALFTCVVFVFLQSFSWGQARLGSSAKDILEEFNESSYERESGYTDDLTYYITIKTSRASVVYFFDSDNYCDRCIIIPEDQGALNFYVEQYNKQYVILSSKAWKMYTSSGIANIDLVYGDDGMYYFLWYNSN